MNLSFAHICIRTPDLLKTRTFYIDVLGMDVAFEFRKDGELFGYYLKMGERNYIEVFKDSDIGAGSSPFLHLCLETDDIHRMHQRLRDHDVQVTDVKRGCDDTFQFWFTDPNGISIELHQYTETSAQLTGRPCEVDW